MLIAFRRKSSIEECWAHTKLGDTAAARVAAGKADAYTEMIQDLFPPDDAPPAEGDEAYKDPAMEE